MFPYSLRLGGYARVGVWTEYNFITFSGNVGPRKKNMLTFRVQSSVAVCVLHTYSEEYESYGLVAAAPAAEAERGERQEEGEEGEGRAPQQQGQCGDLPVWNTHTGGITAIRREIKRAGGQSAADRTQKREGQRGYRWRQQVEAPPGPKNSSSTRIFWWPLCFFRDQWQNKHGNHAVNDLVCWWETHTRGEGTASWYSWRKTCESSNERAHWGQLSVSVTVAKHSAGSKWFRDPVDRNQPK